MLNGAEVVAERDFNQQVASIARVVAVSAANTLAVKLNGGTRGGRITISLVRHLEDAAGPQLALAVPDGQVVAASPLRVTGTSTDASGVASVTVNGLAASVNAAGAFSADVPLVAGPNHLWIEATDCESNTTRRELTVVLNLAPVVTISAPAANLLTRNASIAMSGTVSSASAIQSVVANGRAMTIANNAWSGDVTLTGTDGPRELVVTATDANGKQGSASVTIGYDATAPALDITMPPADITELHVPSFEFSGPASDNYSGLATVTCNGVPATRYSRGFGCKIAFAVGANPIVVRAVDGAGNETTVTRTMQYSVDAIPPTITAIVAETPSPSGWYNSPVTIFFECTDNTGVICAASTFVSRDGANQKVTGEAVDSAGNKASTVASVSVDITNPLLTIDGAHERISMGDIRITGTASDATSRLASLTCNGAPLARNGDRFECVMTLPAGYTNIPVVATDVAGNSARAEVLVFVDRNAPVVTVVEPSAAVVTNDATIEIAGTVTDDDRVASLTIDDEEVIVDDAGVFVHSASLREGANSIVVRATDRAGNAASTTIEVRRYERAVITITSPADFAVLGSSSVTVAGTFTGTLRAITINGVAAAIGGASFTAANVPLAQGRTVVTAIGTTPAGEVVATSLNLYRDSIPPRVEVYSPANGSTVTSSPVAISGMVDDIVIGTINAGQMRVTINGIEATVANRAFVASGVVLVPGVNTLTVTGVDQAGNVATKTLSLTYAPNVARVVVVAGDGQSAPIGATLSDPLRIRLLNADGSPRPNAAVRFEVFENDGTLAAAGESGRALTLTTDLAGEASVQWTLGRRAGAANNKVRVSADGVASAEAWARGVTGAPAAIVVDSGNNQFGVSNEPLPRPIVAVVVDEGSNRLAGVPVTFSVLEGGGSFDGRSSVVVVTDSDGRAVAAPRLGSGSGADNNSFSAVAAGVERGVSFIATGRPGGAVSETRISGVVLDNTSRPVPGVTVRIDETSRSATADANGQFVIDAAPVGYVKLIVDGSTSQRPGTWPTLEFVMYTNAGQDNTIGMPIYLLPVDVTRGVQVDEMRGGTLTFPELPGFSLTIAPGSALFPNGSRAGTVSATLVHADKIPMTPGFGQQPRFIVTIQPPGVHFDPPAAITFPNLDGLPAGSITELYSFDHDLGQFVAIGTGSVSADGTTIASDRGVGIIKGGWHCSGNPAPSGTASCLTLTVSADVPEQTGEATLVSRRMQSQSMAARPRLVRALATADPKVTAVNSCIRITAGGAPAGAGYTYAWTVVSGGGVIDPACAMQSQCTVRGTSQGEVVLKATYTAPTGQTKSETLTVRFVNLQLTLKSVSFLESVVLYRDEPNWTIATSYPTYPPPVPPVPAITQPVWKNTNLSDENNAIAYVRNRTMKAKAVFSLIAPLPVALPKVNFEATISPGLPKLKTAGPFTVPAGATEIEVELVGEQPLPNNTANLSTLMLWNALPPSACTNPLACGTQTQQLYVLLGDPLAKVYLSTAHIATNGGTARNVQEAVEYTWREFGNGLGPTNVRGWKGQPFRYYPAGTPFGQCAWSIEALLQVIDGNTKCGGLGQLAQYAMAANGILSSGVIANPASGTHGFLVKHWRFADQPTYQTVNRWLFVTSHPAPMVNEMVEAPSAGNTYGALVSLDGAAGQWSPTPSQKAHFNHALLKVEGRLLDPSYGLEYVSASDFEEQALDGYFYMIEAFQPDHRRKLAMRVGDIPAHATLDGWP